MSFMDQERLHTRNKAGKCLPGSVSSKESNNPLINPEQNSNSSGSKMTQVALVTGGMLWILFAVGFAIILVQYLFAGAGIQLMPWGLWTGGVLIGLVQVCGIFFASALSFVIGVGMCAYGLDGLAPKRR